MALRLDMLDDSDELPKELKIGEYTIRKRQRFWEVIDATGDLVCLTVYKRGAKEVVRRLCV